MPKQQPKLVVVQRRSDGKFFMNSTRRWSVNHGGGEWTDNLDEVKPFRGLTGVRSAFAPGNIYWGPGLGTRTQSTFVDDCCRLVKWSWRGTTKQCKHYKAARAAAKQKFVNTYRLYEVGLSIGSEVYV